VKNYAPVFEYSSSAPAVFVLLLLAGIRLPARSWPDVPATPVAAIIPVAERELTPVYPDAAAQQLDQDLSPGTKQCNNKTMTVYNHVQVVELVNAA
jgi:hypothetical protein